MDRNEYLNLSGGAQGADLKWDEIGHKYGFNRHIHFRPADYDKRSEEKKKIMELAYVKALDILKRKFYPANTYVGKLMRRSYLQAANADAIYATSDILHPGARDRGGYICNADRTIVAGGTGYAVEFGIALEKDVYVYDQFQDQWYIWNFTLKDFNKCDTPVLTKRYAGIGTRELNRFGIQAIEDVYIKTEENAK